MHVPPGRMPVYELCLQEANTSKSNDPWDRPPLQSFGSLVQRLQLHGLTDFDAAHEQMQFALHAVKDATPVKHAVHRAAYIAISSFKHAEERTAHMSESSSHASSNAYARPGSEEAISAGLVTKHSSRRQDSVAGSASPRKTGAGDMQRGSPGDTLQSTRGSAASATNGSGSPRQRGSG